MNLYYILSFLLLQLFKENLVYATYFLYFKIKHLWFPSWLHRYLSQLLTFLYGYAGDTHYIHPAAAWLSFYVSELVLWQTLLLLLLLQTAHARDCRYTGSRVHMWFNQSSWEAVLEKKKKNRLRYLFLFESSFGTHISPWWLCINDFWWSALSFTVCERTEELMSMGMVLRLLAHFMLGEVIKDWRLASC